MDFSLFSAAVTAVTSARELTKTVIDLRDFNQVAITVSKINEQLLKAQESLFTHNTMLLDLQNQHFKACEELREIKKTISESQRYSLVEISHGIFVYGMNVAPQFSDISKPSSSEPMHYICQSCFQKGIKSVLQRGSFLGSVHLLCTSCKFEYPTGERVPVSV